MPKRPVAQLLRPILEGLQSIVAAGGASAALVFPVLHAIRELRTCAPGHPASHVAVALYDSMVACDRWRDYDAGQYRRAAETLRDAGRSPAADGSAIAKCLAQLWEFGFDITPYGAEPGSSAGAGGNQIE